MFSSPVRFLPVIKYLLTGYLVGVAPFVVITSTTLPSVLNVDRNQSWIHWNNQLGSFGTTFENTVIKDSLIEMISQPLFPSHDDPLGYYEALAGYIKIKSNRYHYKDYGGKLGVLVTEIYFDHHWLKNDPKHKNYWKCFQNGVPSPTGVSSTLVGPNDEIAWRYTHY